MTIHIKKHGVWLGLAACLQVLPALAANTAPADTIPVNDTTQRFIKPSQNNIRLWNRSIAPAANIASVSTGYTSDFSTTPVADITNIAAGRLAGLYTVQNSGRNGSDGSSFSLRGRTPLMVIDGVVRNFTSFNPADIESITVLKDALATAMYGMRASNGVVLVTTRDRGPREFEINASAQYGVTEQLNTPKFVNAFDYANLYNEAQLNSNPTATPRYTPEQLQAWKNHTNDPFLAPDVNWYNTVYKKQSSQQRYNIDIGGNSKSYRYYASLEHFAQDGNFITSSRNSYNTNNDYKRYNIRTNAEIDFNESIRLGLNVFGSMENATEPGRTSSTIMNDIYGASPVAYPVFNKNGSYGGTSVFTNNPHAAAINSGYLLQNQRTVSADLSLHFKLDAVAKGLWAKGVLSMNNYFLETNNRSKTFAVHQLTDTLNEKYTKIGTDGLVPVGVANVSTQIRQAFYNVMAGYDKSWDQHSVSMLGTFNIDNTIAAFNELNQVYKHAGLTASYDWNKTYLFETGMTYGSLNRYQPGKRWGFLPSAGIGWVVSNEPFFHLPVVNFLKIRASAGQTAWADPNNYFLYLQNYTVGSTGYNVGESSAGVSGAFESGVANPDITWEKAWKYNLGIDATLLNNDLTVSADIYRNRFYDQLQQPGNASGIFGQTYPLENLRATRYSGVELTAAYQHTTVSNLEYFVKGNIAFSKNELLEADEPAYPYPWQYKTGLSSNQLFGYVADGFFTDADVTAGLPTTQGYKPVPGDIKYVDQNKDGVINALDSRAIGTNKPLIFYGLNAGFKFKGFDLNFLLQGTANRYISLSPTSMAAFNNSYGNVQEFHKDRWTPATAATALYPRLTIGGNANNDVVSSFWLRNGNYLRLKNAELGYSCSPELLKRAKIQQLRIFINGYNLLTHKELKEDIDPESALNVFRNQRIINGGISLKL
ncbi:SusC/RagA family TonB-linked outer membrane protein [uncultured Chitinophaga sp.]|uniref:SusC/RagA family TonB-linked outer membrane protein n=1 Tax=uncultured Chitinophaga sp. TaxID=339340 RepID=UPI0025E9C266|nr:SusC/RagA family TonB-linked outer membrane protein [uncultured Chitinophaga sp.]